MLFLFPGPSDMGRYPLCWWGTGGSEQCLLRLAVLEASDKGKLGSRRRGPFMNNVSLNQSWAPHLMSLPH